MAFKVALIHPFLKEAQNKNRLKFRESLALGYLSAALHEAGIAYRSINAELEFLDEATVAGMINEDGDVGLVGISCKSQRTFKAAVKIASLIKAARPDLHITVGGVLATAADVELLERTPVFDSVVRGEGEEAIVGLSKLVEAGSKLHGMLGLTFRDGTEIVQNAPRSRIRNLNKIAFPRRDDLRYALDTGGQAEASAYIVASRGCYAACTFCSIHQIYGNRLVVRRDPANIVQEIELVVANHSVRRFSFVDDIFLTPSAKGIRWVEEFCDLLIERDLKINFYAEMRADTLSQPLLAKLRKAGMHRVFIGFEAGVDSVLQRWDKGTTVSDNDHAIVELRKSDFDYYQINMGYIMFDPEMTFEELKGQYNWLKGTGLAKVQHLQNKMNIYWGTPHYDRMIAQGRINDAPFGDRWEYNFDDPKVGFVERCLRKFHRSFEETQSEDLLQAKEAFRSFVRVHEDLVSTARPAWATKIIGQAHRRVEKFERDLYYSVFEKSFAYLDQGGDVTELELYFDGLWSASMPYFEQLAFEARQLSALIRAIEAGISFRFKEHDGAIDVSLNVDEKGEVVYSVGKQKSGDDRYDHACEITVIPNGSDAKILPSFSLLDCLSA